MIFNRTKKIIASLTSYPLRINTVHLAIESILAQTKKADKIILWLSHEEFPNREQDLPLELLTLRGWVEIGWCDNIRSYKKLISALKKYPDDIIITFDDDLIFDEKTIELLYTCNKKYKNDIIAHRITRMFYNERDELDIFPRHHYYSNQDQTDYLSTLKEPSFFNKLSGGAGCLYPPACFHSDVLDDKEFMYLAPTSDDIWFWLQAVRNKTRIRVPAVHLPVLQYIPGTQEVGLFHINDTGEKLFFVHLRSIIKHYPEIIKIMRCDCRKNDKTINSIKRW